MVKIKRELGTRETRDQSIGCVDGIPALCAEHSAGSRDIIVMPKGVEYLIIQARVGSQCSIKAGRSTWWHPRRMEA